MKLKTAWEIITEFGETLIIQDKATANRMMNRGWHVTQTKVLSRKAN